MCAVDDEPGPQPLDNPLIELSLGPRLLTALAYNPMAIGIGLDEDTAAFLGPDETLRVVGSGALTIVDPTDMEHSSMDSAARHEPVCILGLRVHILVDGATYDLRTRKAAAPPEGRGG